MMDEGPSKFRVMTAFAAVYIVWGSTYLAIRFGVETIPPFMMAGTRFIIAGCCCMDGPGFAVPLARWGSNGDRPQSLEHSCSLWGMAE